MNTLSPLKLLALGVWAFLWLLLAITFVIPGLGDDPTYDRWRYIAGGVFVVLTLAGFAGHAWWARRQSPRKPGLPQRGLPVPGASMGIAPPPVRKKTGADLPTVLRDRPKTGVAPAPLKPRAAGPATSDGTPLPVAPIETPPVIPAASPAPDA